MSSQILARRHDVVARGVNTAFPVVIATAEGSYLTDVDGNVFLDFTGGIGCLNVGSRHPRVQEAARQQLDLLVHTSAQCLFNEPYVELAERLAEAVPIDGGGNKAFLVNSGSEAVENAVKIARRHTGRAAIVAFRHAFHGRTATALSLTDRADPFKLGFGPFTPEVYRAKFPDPYHDDLGEDAAADIAMRDVRRVVLEEVGASNTAAIIVEPVQGEAGFIVPPVRFFEELSRFCEAHGILLIADEIQSGMGRTGAMFASELLGLRPDLMTVGKSLASGFPLAAVVGRGDVMDSPSPGGLGGTYTGNPVACAAALATLQVIKEEGLVERGAEMGAWLEERTRGWPARFACVGNVRGLGAMWAVEFVSEEDSRRPAPEICLRVREACMREGLLMLPAGTHNNVMRFLGPLTLTDAELEMGFAILESAIESCA